MQDRTRVTTTSRISVPYIIIYNIRVRRSRPRRDTRYSFTVRICYNNIIILLEQIKLIFRTLFNGFTGVHTYKTALNIDKYNCLVLFFRFQIKLKKVFTFLTAKFLMKFSFCMVCRGRSTHVDKNLPPSVERCDTHTIRISYVKKAK